ncbi:uncharacterized protein [Rutidosis leptorrhynchoides]|uniref:uncharacterized protein n=1 Tax=Rutidosis leptorrhynchoides TaxID=125765 RepID=UPI003A998231
MLEEASTALTLISKIDFGDPLYLHASDTTGTPIIPIKLKGTENYAIWSRSMRLALSTKNKVGFVDATCIKNTEDAVLASQWDRCNSVVLSWILGSISEDLYSGQIYSTVASVVWNELKDTYDKVDGSNIFNLHMKINSLKQNGASVSDYYHNLNSLWKQYDEMDKLPACTREAANVAQEQTKILRLNQFLMGLDDEFMQIRSNILLRDPIPDAKTAFAVISREESHRRLFLVMFQVKVKTLCFEVVGYPPHYKKPSNNNKSFRSNNSVISNSTNESSSSDGLSSVPSSSLSLTNDQMTKLLSLLNDTPAQSSNACNNMEGWIIDSGANQHMTVSEKKLFNVVDISDFNLKVSHPNGTEARVRKIGDLKLTAKIVLHDVLVVPGYCVSLLFVSKMADDNDLLGHPSSPVLHVLKDKLNLNSKDCDFPCEICLKAKQTRDVFQNSDHKSKNLGGGVFIELLAEKDIGIIHQTTIPYTPQQNGVVERKHRHLLNVARSLMFQVGIPLNMWPECVLTATYLINRTPSKILAGKSPFEMVHGFEPNLSHLKNFGCLVFSKVLNESDKFSSKSEKAVFIDSKVNKNLNDEGRGVLNEVIQVVDPTGSTSLVGGGSLDNLNDDNSIPEVNSHDQTNFSENIVPASIRRSDRVSVLPRKFDDYIIKEKVKYGLEKAASDPNWIAAMNDEIQALFRNNTWILTDTENRKPIGCK